MPSALIVDRIWRWFDERLGLGSILRACAVHALNPVYSLGGLSFLFFSILAVTGVILAMQYTPTPEGAYDSVQTISTVLQYGWLIRGIHFYAANCLIITSIFHMLKLHLKGGYRKPQELNWIVGIGIGALAFMSGFTGYVLRWDQEAVGAAGIGKGLAVSVPQLGKFLVRFFFGQSNTDTVHRLFTSHTVLLPGLIVSLLALHYFMIRRHGFEVLVSEAYLAPVIIGLLMILVSAFPVKLGQRFDPMNPPTVLEPEWFFMGLYQFLKTENIQPFHGFLLLAALGFCLMAVPFMDRIFEGRAWGRPLLMSTALFVIIEFLGLTIYGYLSPGQVGTFSDVQFTEAFSVTNLAALGSVILIFANSRHRRGSPRFSRASDSVVDTRSESLSKNALALTIALAILETFLVYEAMRAYEGGSERVFGFLSGLMFLCFASLLYTASIRLRTK